MSYLPPAGQRVMMDRKISYLPTCSEIPNIFSMRKPGTRPRKPTYAHGQLPPLSQHPEDWILPEYPAYPKFWYDKSPMQPFCSGLPNSYPYRPTVTRCAPVMCEDQMPYGFPKESYDVRRRADWFNYWAEENFRYVSAFKLWENKFGAKYLYTKPRC
ncbi:uncharacterized protein LOC131935187 [Physella acuta]|uniref:uncharacterized protein LOC131935187 n=1 Tax=Physella acuta TaxID=109671 RepID=UPI0027DB0B0A|nr:uncharacterized protein LOC131935187 [Physella acuta]XP_059147540.1 uncharacterized protein LOC131935187 [Physella acuta]